MSDVDQPPPDDADRSVDLEDDLDPEAPTDSTLTHPPREDADRPVPGTDGYDEDPLDEFQQENAGTSLDQPSGQV
jgi:hypothetical protein